MSDMNPFVINGNRKVRAQTMEMIDILEKKRAQRESVQYAEAGTNTEIDQRAVPNKGGPKSANRLPFSIDNILANKPQDGSPKPADQQIQVQASEADQGALPPFAKVLFAAHQAAQLPTPVIGASSAALGSGLGTGFTSPFGSELLDSGASSLTTLMALPTASAPIRKRAAPWEQKPVETGVRTSTKKFVQTAPKTPELAFPTPGTSTTMSAEQFSLLLQFYQQSPESITGLLNSLPQVERAPIGSLEAFQASNQSFVDSVMGRTGGQAMTSSGGGASSEATLGFGFPSSSSSFGGPQDETADSDNNDEKH